METVKKTLMIHEMSEKILKLDLAKYILTFDDGLYSQFFYWNLLKKIPTTKIFFIPTGAIRLEETVRLQFSGEHLNFPTCYEAMDKWFTEDNLEDYITLGEIKQLKHEGAVLGGHGHHHIKNYSDCFIHRLEEIRKDTVLMKDWFTDHLNHSPSKYCFPFNQEYSTQRAAIKVETGITEFYGKERIDVMELL